MAVKRPDQRWLVTIDGEVRNVLVDDNASSGFDEVPFAFREDGCRFFVIIPLLPPN